MRGAVVSDKSGRMRLVVEIHVEILALKRPIPAERDFEPGANGPPTVVLSIGQSVHDAIERGGR